MTPNKKPTNRQRALWLETVPTQPLLMELNRRALGEPKLRGLILKGMGELLATISAQFGIRIAAEWEEFKRADCNWTLQDEQPRPEAGSRPPSINPGG